MILFLLTKHNNLPPLIDLATSELRAGVFRLLTISFFLGALLLTFVRPVTANVIEWQLIEAGAVCKKKHYNPHGDHNESWIIKLKATTAALNMF